ncbi:Nif3-like dinuclear metal center hexameric protein [Marinobacterium lutimaris]|uniref:Dinuclear metal center protein, YbgI/SA1388 family n=1 Tax=Marinobacterium lutimaris TaxID=568106 RepID=A0A1H6AYT0_9GAMM|nr:Nif3-like dinuclear metal center hexameric protein [Marinobacterium lutimaris]SEG53524.1 dinuclear metal center protein, YbgI/SA1388 family [Marinobacterium lutimaris]
MTERKGVSRTALVEYCDQILQSSRFKDYCPNGLQVEGRSQVAKILTGVTACQALLDEAVAWGADLVLVHHGYFWKGEPAQVTGIKHKRLKTLLGADINLLAYHLPLDAHPEYGNNARLGHLLGIDVQSGLEPGNPLSVGNMGVLEKPLTLEEMTARVERVLGRTPQVVSGGDRLIHRIGWCTGSADRMVEQAEALGADAFLTGEISEPVVHFAREAGIHYIGAGHHATERYGVQALGEHLARHFGLEHRFVDIDNPV